jgi:hypothetical protein
LCSTSTLGGATPTSTRLRHRHSSTTPSSVRTTQSSSGWFSISIPVRPHQRRLGSRPKHLYRNSLSTAAAFFPTSRFGSFFITARLVEPSNLQPSVMSAPLSPENSINSAVFGHDRRRMSAFGCVVSFVIRWSGTRSYECQHFLPVFLASPVYPPQADITPLRIWANGRHPTGRVATSY